MKVRIATFCRPLLTLTALFISISLSGCLGGSSSADEDFHPGVGTPRLSLSATQSFDDVYVGGSDDLELTVTNSGNAAAVRMSSATLSAPYHFKDGTYPGTGGNCGDTLAAGSSCQLVVEFRPTSRGEASATLSLTYYNGDSNSARAASFSLRDQPLAGTAGTLDSQTFAGTGTFSEDYGSSHEQADFVKIQADGKILFGSISHLGGINWDTIIRRFDANGNLDTSYGTSGTVRLEAADHSGARLFYMEPTSDGKLLVLLGSNWGGQREIVLLTATGAIETDFGTNGVIDLDAITGLSGVTHFAIQDDGKIVTGGTISNGSDADFAIFRYEADGDLDLSFGTNGVVLLDILGNDSAVGFAIEPLRGGHSEQRILVGGYVNGSSSALLRLEADGDLDTTFGTNGVVNSGYGGVEGYGVPLFQADGKILVIGAYDIGTIFSVIARYLPDGDLDPTFGNGDGVLDAQFETMVPIYALDSDGIGYGFYNGDLAVVGNDGSLITSYDLPAGFSVRNLHLQCDGKMLLVGTRSNGTHNDAVFIRLWL